MKTYACPNDLLFLVVDALRSNINEVEKVNNDLIFDVQFVSIDFDTDAL
jgi:hypothetical protein